MIDLLKGEDVDLQVGHGVFGCPQLRQLLADRGAVVNVVGAHRHRCVRRFEGLSGFVGQCNSFRGAVVRPVGHIGHPCIDILPFGIEPFPNIARGLDL